MQFKRGPDEISHKEKYGNKGKKEEKKTISSISPVMSGLMLGSRDMWRSLPSASPAASYSAREKNKRRRNFPIAYPINLQQ